jgi:hypothetical protein
VELPLLLRGRVVPRDGTDKNDEDEDELATDAAVEKEADDETDLSLMGTGY